MFCIILEAVCTIVDENNDQQQEGDEAEPVREDPNPGRIIPNRVVPNPIVFNAYWQARRPFEGEAGRPGLRRNVLKGVIENYNGIFSYLINTVDGERLHFGRDSLAGQHVRRGSLVSYLRSSERYNSCHWKAFYVDIIRF